MRLDERPIKTIKSLEECRPAITVWLCFDGSYTLQYCWDSTYDNLAHELRKQAYRLVEAAIDRDYPGLGRYASTIGTGKGIRLSVDDIRPEHRTTVPYTEIPFQLIP